MESTTQATHCNPRTALLLAAAVLIVFAPVLGHGFVHWDDYGTLAANDDFNPSTLPKLAGYWRGPYMELYIPVTYSVWAVVAKLAYQPPANPAAVGLNPHLFHAANLVVHAASAMVAYLILGRLVRNRRAAEIGALVFALHPVQVEPVAWVSGMKDVLSGLLGLLAIHYYFREAELSPARVRPGRAFAAASACYVLAMLAKPSAVVVPAVVAAMDLLLLVRPRKAVAVRVGLWLAAAMPIIAVGRLVQPASAVANVPLWFRPIVAVDSLGFYISKVFWPAQLVVDYGRSPQWLRDHPSAWPWTIAATAVAIGVAWAIRRRSPAVSAGVLVFALALLPVLGLVGFDFQSYSTVADHYMYLAMLGAALAAAALLARYPQRLVQGLAIVAVCALGLRAHLQSYLWHDTQRLFAHNVRVNPDSAPAHRALGVAALRRGELEEAAVNLDRALQIMPQDALAQALRGDVWLRLDRPQEALEYYLRAVAADPQSANYLTRAGIAYRHGGDGARAAEYLQRALKLRPGYYVAHVHLAELADQRGDFAAAAEHRRLASASRGGSPADLSGE